MTSLSRFGAARGSPPRMRGKQEYRQTQNGATGITPADAGKTVPVCLRKQQPQDHPRGCGENQDVPATSRKTAGSPPRMRGKPSLYASANNSPRITPADAGKTPQKAAMKLMGKDHPRGCGENYCIAFNSVDLPGSPPRMRGKLYGRGLQRHGDRITPADAGKTLKRSFRNQPFCS